jgi:formylglycine-generating enzyme required for sulfatase activity
VSLNSFAIGKFEVTFDEYAVFAAATGRSLPDDLDWGRRNRPVINVSWDDASAYTRWLSRQTGQNYRLPTEAEWEYAAAAGTNSLYWWGYEPSQDLANCFNCGSRWDGRSPAPVGSFDANPYGLHDVAGNVMEWVEDCYHINFKGAPTNGSAWVEPGCKERVVRGAAFNKPMESLRTTRRSGEYAQAGYFAIGFRVVRELNP